MKTNVKELEEGLKYFGYYGVLTTPYNETIYLTAYRFDIGNEFISTFCKFFSELGFVSGNFMSSSYPEKRMGWVTFDIINDKRVTNAMAIRLTKIK